MKTNRLYNIAEQNGIAVDRAPLTHNKSFSMAINDKMYVALDGNISGAQERVCLAHELGHCETAGFYNIYSPIDIRGKYERRADLWAIKRLVPKTRYQSAIKKFDNIFSLAEHFDVTAEFMQKAVDYYSKAQ